MVSQRMILRYVSNITDSKMDIPPGFGLLQRTTAPETEIFSIHHQLYTVV